MCQSERGWEASSGPAEPLEPAHRAPEHPVEAVGDLKGKEAGVTKWFTDLQQYKNKKVRWEAFLKGINKCTYNHAKECMTINKKVTEVQGLFYLTIQF